MERKNWIESFWEFIYFIHLSLSFYVCFFFCFDTFICFSPTHHRHSCTLPLYILSCFIHIYFIYYYPKRNNFSRDFKTVNFLRCLYSRLNFVFLNYFLLVLFFFFIMNFLLLKNSSSSRCISRVLNPRSVTISHRLQ